MEPEVQVGESESKSREYVCVCGKEFVYASGLSKHKRKCGMVRAAAGVQVSEVHHDSEAVNHPEPVEPVLELPLERELSSDTDLRKENLIHAIDGMIKSCPQAGLVRKCSIESSIHTVEKEHRQVQQQLASHLNTQVFMRVLLTGCHAIESLTQIPNVKQRVDLQGYTEAVAKDPNVPVQLRECLLQYPELLQYLTPEVKLGLTLLTSAVVVAQSNVQKKLGDHGSASATGASESKP